MRERRPPAQFAEVGEIASPSNSAGRIYMTWTAARCIARQTPPGPERDEA